MFYLIYSYLLYIYIKNCRYFIPNDNINNKYNSLLVNVNYF